MLSKTLLALTASALALPGIAGKARADTAPTSSTVSYRASSYREDDLDADRLLAGALDRYDIKIQQFRLVAPLSAGLAMTMDASYESMSGASPWYQLQTPSGPGVVMSGATISERRADLSLGAQRFLANGSYSLSVGASQEDDYEALNGALAGERHFNANLTTLSGGLSFSNDELEPSEASLFGRIQSADKRTRSAYAAVTQVLSQTSLVQTGLNYTEHEGFLSDPYKLGDRRPDTRRQWAWSSGWRRFFVGADAALHVDYRLYDDSFGVNSHTLDLAWHQNLGRRWQLIPGLRWYSQSSADFYRPVLDFTLGTQPQSSDYRLAAFGALSPNLTVHMRLDDLRITLAAERYLADESYSAHEVAVENPALVDFTRLSLGLDYSF